MLRRPFVRCTTIQGILAAASIMFARQAFAGTPSSWNGTVGAWSDAARWSSNPFFPDNGNGAAAYDARIGAGVVNLDVDVEIASLTLDGGSLSGAGSVVVDNLVLNGGTLGTTGSVAADNAALTKGTLARDLTLSATGTNTIRSVVIAMGNKLTLPVGATLTAGGDGTEAESIGPGELAIQGTFVKTGAQRYYASTIVNNDGLVQVLENNLRLNSAGTHTGDFDVAAGAQLELAGTQSFGPSSRVVGEGGLLIISGTATIDGDVLTGFVRLVDGSLDGSGNLLPDYFLLEQGSLVRDLMLPATTGNRIKSIAIEDGRTLTVPAGGTLTAGMDVETGSGGLGTLVNQGLFIKSGSHRFYADMTMNNQGVVQVDQNNLRLNNGGDHSGTFAISAGAQLELGGSQLLHPTAMVSGDGGLLVVSGTATINSEVATGFVRLVNGALAGSGNLHPEYFLLEGGSLARDLTLPTTAGNRIKGVMIESGRTLTVPAGATLTAGIGDVEAGSNGPGTLINQGTFVKMGSKRYYASMVMNNESLVQVQQNNLRLDLAGTHTGTFEVANGAQLELGGNQLLHPTATVSGQGGLLVVSGTAAIHSEVATDFLRTVGGVLAGGGNLHPRQYVFSGGALGRDITLANTATHTLESLEVTQGFKLTNPAGVAINASAGVVKGAGEFLNRGLITKTGGGKERFEILTNDATGQVVVQAGSLELFNLAPQAGMFSIASGAELQFGGSGRISVDATYQGDGVLRNLVGSALQLDDDADVGVRLINQGTLAVGAAPSSASIEWLTLASGGTLSLKIGGLAMGQFDSLAVDGAVNFGGLIDVSLIDWGSGLYEPELGDTVTVMTFDSSTGAFQNPGGEAVGGMLRLEPRIYAEHLELQAVPLVAGDINLDGKVDIFDVAEVSNHWGESGPAGDVNGDRMVNILDIAGISNHWGGLQTAVVPEPGAGTLALVGALVWLRWRPRRS